MKARILFTSFALGLGLALGLLALLDGPSAPSALAGVAHAAPERNGTLTVEVLTGEEWRVVGEPAFERHPAERRIDLSNLGLSGRVRVRVGHAGGTAAHVDAVLLDGRAPVAVDGAAEVPDLVLRKLAGVEHDVVHATGRTLTLLFDAGDGGAAVLALTARIEPLYLSRVPFQFPPENLYREMAADAAFYTYAWDSAPGGLAVDGDLAGEALGDPFFRERCEPGSGHPAGDTYGWVRNDGDSLYVALDFVPDNTMDGERDYARVYVNTPTGLRLFTVSAPEQAWGRPGFVYTPRAVYQHKVYEFAISLAELGLGSVAVGDGIELAFAAYGTAAPPPPLYPGYLDSDFGGDGVVTTTIGEQSTARGVAIRPDGVYVVAGESAWGGSYTFTGMRYTADGTPTGVVTTSIGTHSFGRAIVLQPDGKSVVAGHSWDGTYNYFTLARYTSGGSPDATFGSSGVVTTSIGTHSFGHAVALQPDGKIVVAGESARSGSVFFTLARYTTTGSLDAAFGSGGVVTTVIGSGEDRGYGVALQPDGKIVVAGTCWAGADNDFCLARYTAGGALDAGFGSNGVVTTPVGSGYDNGYAVALQSDGKIVVAGACDSGGGDSDFCLVRYTSGGTLDGDFGPGGVVTTDFGSGSQDWARAVAVQGDGKIVVAGTNVDWYIALARYNRDGSPDPTFGRLGYRVNTDVGAGDDMAYALALQRNGRILVAGYSDTGSAPHYALVRYAPANCQATIDGVTVYTSTGARAVQAAVDAATAGDVVKVAGTCVGVQARGGLTQTLYVSKSVTIRGGYAPDDWTTPDPTAHPTALDARRWGRVVVVSGTAAALQNIALVDGDATGIGDGNGGGLAVYASVVTVSHGSVISNRGRYGGGIYNSAGQVTIEETVIRDNAADDSGGGIGNGGVMALAGVTLTHNTAITDGGGIGNRSGGTVVVDGSQIIGNRGYHDAGGIGNDGALLISNGTLISDNAALDPLSFGGGILNDGGVMTMTGSSIISNAAYAGGGILNAGSGSGVVVGSTIAHNQGSYTGGIYNGGTLILTNTTVSSNTSSNGVGGIKNWAFLTLVHCTIADNSGGGANTGGLWNGVPAGAHVRSTIVAGNHHAANPDVYSWSSEPFDDQGYNLIGDATGSVGLTATTTLSNTDPLLDPLADNGGETQTHALQSGSPAMDRVPAGVNGCGTAVTTDQRGVVRLAGGGCDVGAYEVISSVYLPLVLRDY